jgi:hypothetical protein
LENILCSIINSTLCNFLDEHNVLSRSQIGYLPNYRTTDHIYTNNLHILIDKQVNQNKGKIYSWFVDFKKAFYSICHKGL